MLNFRKLRRDFSPNIVKEGKELFEKQKILSAKLLHLDAKTLCLTGQVLGQFDNSYESKVEINRHECELIDSDCDCPYNCDCQHLAALLFYLEHHLDHILVTFSKENDLQKMDNVQEREQLLEKIKEAEIKEVQRHEEQYQREFLDEYINAAKLLAGSPFFRAPEKKEIDRADLEIVFTPISAENRTSVELQFVLRMPLRTKPLFVPNAKKFLEALQYEEPLFIGSRKYCFSLDSFAGSQKNIAKMIIDCGRTLENAQTDKQMRIVHVGIETFGMMLAECNAEAIRGKAEGLTFYSSTKEEEEDEEKEARKGSLEINFTRTLGIYEGSLDAPVKVHPGFAQLSFSLEYIPPPTCKVLINPVLFLHEKNVQIDEVCFLECAKPGLLYKGTYFRFPENICRSHLKGLKEIRDMTIPQPLFGTLIENALVQMSCYGKILNPEAVQQFVTLPFVGQLQVICDLSYLDGELEANVSFNYEGKIIPYNVAKLTCEDLQSFVTKKGILARNLVEESQTIDDLFQDFLYIQEAGTFVTKSEKKIVEFMTEVVPRNRERVLFHCPQNLLDQFVYDKTQCTLTLKETDRIDVYQIALKVDGDLRGVSIDQLWECLNAKKGFIELHAGRSKSKKGEPLRPSKILVLDLERLSGVVQFFDEMGIEVLDDCTLERPLWNLANIDHSQFEGLPVAFSMSKRLEEIRKQMLGESHYDFAEIPEEIRAKLRNYQKEGVRWLERLRSMYLNGILADDMGLGKTLQAIVALAQAMQKKGGQALVVCPTSLLYNWKEEISKFHPHFKVMVVDGIPNQRKKLLASRQSYDVLITSYTLLQKDIEQYSQMQFVYAILDEAQHIKNRGTRNAKSVKMIKAVHRLILSGTPIENSLEELWSLFDFLMPGFLGTFERFVEKYVRAYGKEQSKNLNYLRKKVAPFILRRMKSEVLDDLPPISEIVYHCQLTDVQKELYYSYAATARDELVKLVERDGFDRVQIHVLATLTRLKQICCHPAIFAKEKAEPGDSAKYEMLQELLHTLIEGKHKTVIFSQYTRMLEIMRNDFTMQGVPICYLDGGTKNRLEIVKQFNEDPSIPIFLVSLKAGGTGLNLVGADTVIHYDMWWNPAVESQATDRVHRLGQKQSVSTYKLITLGTIEEKIAEKQRGKKGLVKKVVSCDDEAISRLTWEDVLEILET